jgi:hypothetical protein
MKYVRIKDGMKYSDDNKLMGFANDIVESAGVVDKSGGDFLVRAQISPNMSLRVNPGTVYVVNSSWVQNGNETHYFQCFSTEIENLNINSNSSGSTRVDLVCAKIDKVIDPGEYGELAFSLVIVGGIPGAGVPATPANHYKLAEVAVVSGATSVTSGNITDRRIDFTIRGGTSVDIDTDGNLAANSDSKVASQKATKTYADAKAAEITNPSANAYGLFNNSLCRQTIINGNFLVNQRVYVSNATLAAGVYGHDRWKAGASGGDYTFTQLPSSTTITIKTGKSLIQVVEDKNVVGGHYTLSWTGTAQARFGINSATPSGAYAASPITITTQTAGTVMSVEFNEGTLGKVGICSGDVALPFMPKSFDDELRACQRYYEKSYNYSDAPGTSVVATGNSQVICIAQNTAATTVVGGWPGYKVVKRIPVGITFYSPAGNINKVLVGASEYSGATSNGVSDSSIGFYMTSLSGLVVNQCTTVNFCWTSSAEL